MNQNAANFCLVNHEGNEESDDKEFFDPKQILSYVGVLSCKVFTVDKDSQHGFYDIEVTSKAIQSGKSIFGKKKDKVIVKFLFWNMIDCFSFVFYFFLTRIIILIFNK